MKQPIRRRLQSSIILSLRAAAIAVLATSLGLTPSVPAADSLTSLFGDPVLVTGKGVEVKQSHLDEEFITLRASLAARQEELPETLRSKAEISLLEQLVVNQLLSQRATEGDRTNAAGITKRFLDNSRKEAGNTEESFARIVRGMGMSVNQYEDRLSRKSLSETVIERELGPSIKITDEEVKKFYADNNDRFLQPEIAKGQYIIVYSRDPKSGTDLTPDVLKPKRDRLLRALSRARSGEDFKLLVKEYTEEPEAAERRGEFTIPKINRLPEVESAVFSLPINAVSDVIAAAGALHVLKVTERSAARQVEFEKVKDDIRKDLTYREMVNKLPSYFLNLKKDAGLTVVNQKYKGVLDVVAPLKSVGEDTAK